MLDSAYQLEDRYTRESGRVYLTGIQALVRLPLMQRRMDERAGLKTAGFISGYRGSPLGAYDQELWRAQRWLEMQDIHFEPGINEDMAATAIWGTQLLDYYRDQATRDGVFSLWYGKGHGVDRTGDVFRQANVQGTSRYGGVLALAGDDHTAESSMFPHQTDQVFEAAIMPVLFPSSVEEYLSMGLAGIALSRFCGLWVAFKTITETVESGASIELPAPGAFKIPRDFTIPPHGLNYDSNFNWPAQRMEYERRMIEERAPAAHAFVYANGIDRVVVRAPRPRCGIVTTGKAHGDLLEALRVLDIGERELAEAGIGIYKVGMSWPLEPRGIAEFARGLQSLLVIEEKRPQLEKQIKEQLYNWLAKERPLVLGKRDRRGDVLLPETGAFTPERVAHALAQWLRETDIGAVVAQRLSRFPAQSPSKSKGLLVREPYFCSGCPHNTSTRVPEGSMAGAGIGCHIMVLNTDRKTHTFTHMGGEGGHWVGLHRFSSMPHMFQNLGDGTYQHSGIMAIRQAVASGVNITYKILLNDAVAMTGGQPAEGDLSPARVARQLLAEGVRRVTLVSDEPGRHRHGTDLPREVSVHERDNLDAIQRECRELEGVTAILYEQTCAAEKRRRRKRGTLEDPDRRIFINERICEGCGDCSVQSNCISVEPLETPFGRKRRINQSTCNKDYSCVKGFCPSFVSVRGAKLRTPDTGLVKSWEDSLFARLPEVEVPALSGNYGILVAGIGGTGVLTIGALLSMAAHLEGRGATTLDFTGLSQKNGAVVAHVKLARHPEDIKVPRILDGGADLLLGCDMVAATGSLAKLQAGRTRCLINTAEVPVAEFTRNNDLFFPAQATRDEFARATREEDVTSLDATDIARTLFGDSIATNLFMLGFAWQQRLVPLSREALERAIELNGVAVDFNRRAFQWGRLAAFDMSAIESCLAGVRGETGQAVVPLRSLEDQVNFYSSELAHYQNSAYARRYRSLIDEFRAGERERLGAEGELSALAARYLYKVMAYKDEYEVARLYSDPAFRERLERQFSGDFKLRFHLAPPLLARRDKFTGLPRKIEFGGWMMSAFRLLAKTRFLRGTVIDPFARTAERRAERKLIEDYVNLMHEIMRSVDNSRRDTAVRLLALPEQVRGYGHVKARNLERVQSEWERLLADYRRPAVNARAA